MDFLEIILDFLIFSFKKPDLSLDILQENDIFQDLILQQLHAFFPMLPSKETKKRQRGSFESFGNLRTF